MKKMNVALKGLMISAFLVGFSACTKEVPYTEAGGEKFNAHSKSEIDTTGGKSGQFIFSSAMLNASRSSEDALPFASGDNKRVKLVWTDSSLQVLEVEQDARFKDNTTNDKLVLDIPVEHLSYECAKDKFGECTNSETTNDKIPWNERPSFKFKPEQSKSATLELLPILSDRAFGGNCYEEKSTRLVGAKIENDALNFDIERTFLVNIDCLSALDKLGDATISAVFHYSMVKADSVLTPGFKPVTYPAEDENTFGFFTTERNILDKDNNQVEKGKLVLMNHWNPNRKVIDYYLSKEFSKPANAEIRKLSYETVDSINAGLKLSGAQFQIKLHDGTDQNPGDIRNSMIVLVEDPVASSIIGYGPQTEDPMTGEIISARTVMFLGTIKKNIRYEYEAILRENKRAALMAAGNAAPGSVDGADDTSVNGRITVDAKLNAKSNAAVQKVAKAITAKPGKTKALPKFEKATAGTLAKAVRNYTRNRNEEYDTSTARGKYKYLQEAKNCSMESSGDVAAGSGDGGISPILAAKFKDATKEWTDMTEKEKQDVIDILLPAVWVPTLIHEMGHNLGLRHNFQGSEDKDNFFSPTELAALKIDHPIPFTSVMEYADDLRALPVMGKYDIAALRFGYLRKVELADGSIVDVKENISSMKKADTKLALKDYGYCTDEHTGINAGCRRFDIGTNYTDIIKNAIQDMEDKYKLRHTRGGAANFSLVDDVGYAGRTLNRFVQMRLMQEVYERIKGDFGLEDDAAEWTSIPFLKDLKDASKLAADYMLSVMMTPDLTCAVARASAPTQIIQVVPLEQVSNSALSCFDLQLTNPAIIIAGQYGKSFHSKKDPNSENHFADQIDVRGFWIDKLMAARALYKRNLRISTLDKYTDNFTDRKDIADDLMTVTNAMILNQISAPQALTLKDGSTVMVNVPLDLHTGMKIEKPLFSGIAKAIGIPDAKVHFNQVLASETVANMLSDDEHKVSGKPFADELSVVRILKTDSFQVPANFVTLEIGSDVLVAGPQNGVAYEAIVTHNTISAIAKVDEARLKTIIDALKAGTALPADLTPEETAVSKLPVAVLEAFVAGKFQDPAFYVDVANMLPNLKK